MKKVLLILFCLWGFNAGAQTILKTDSSSVWVGNKWYPKNTLHIVQVNDSTTAILDNANTLLVPDQKYSLYKNGDSGNVPFANKDSLNAWIRRSFFVDASVNGGVPNLQSVTDIGSGTTKAIQIGNGVNNNDAITVGQVYAVGRVYFSELPATIVSTDTLTVTRGGTYTFTGSVAKAWKMPTVANATGMTLFIINRGSAALTINSNTGGSDLDVNGVYSASIIIAAGENYVLRGNSLKLVTVNN